MRPDLYAAYLHGASQWDGTYAPIAENGVAVYIFMAENDEYYGSQKARSAYENLLNAYRETGLFDSEIEPLLKLDIPDNAYFNQRGIYGNYHGGGNIVFQNTDVLNWITSARKTQEALSFTDVPADAYYADAVAYVKEHGLMNGTSATTFNPNGTTSRGQIASILYRAAGSPTFSGGTAFPDVADTAYYATAIRWASANNIVGGYTNGSFGPNDPITREQLATILWRYAGQPAAEAGTAFADESSIASYAVTAVNWARNNGILSGKAGNRFDPKGNATRGQAAVILKNYLEKS
jgi:hypothetical protein